MLLRLPPSDMTKQCVGRAEGGSESYGICSHVRTPSGPDRSGRGPYYGEKAMSMTEEQWQKGLEVFDQVYGPGSSDMVKPFKDSPFNHEIVANRSEEHTSELQSLMRITYVVFSLH